jgi:hypothetical protein
MDKAKFTSAEGCASNQNQASKHTGWKSAQFLSLNAILPLTLKDGFGFTVFLTG